MSKKLNDLINSASDWKSLKNKISTLTKKEKGDTFELFTKYFLKSHPDYSTLLKHVWLFSELTPKQKHDLSIPANDQGIDLVAQTNSGDFWAIQCKYLEDENQRLTHDYISTFGNLAFAISGKFSFGLVCTTAERFSKAYIGQETISFCTSEVWHNLSSEEFDNIRSLAKHKPIHLEAYKPFPHQQRAIKNAVEHFNKQKGSRGKLILPCGSGKSLTGFWIAQRLNAKKIIVAVPSLALVRQTLNTWLRESVANNMKVDWICVCSDETIGKQDDVAVLVQDLGIPCTTDVKFISEWLKRKTAEIKVAFTTYQSGEVIAKVASDSNTVFDLGIMDEAHKTVGQKGKLFSHLLYDENIRISKRVFMTATERRFMGSSDEIASMDNPALYGETFDLLSFKEALELSPPILSDYRIITVAVSPYEIQELIKANAYVRPSKGSWNKEVEAHTLTSIIALRKAMQKYPIKHAVSFHSSIARAKAFEENQVKFTEVMPSFEPIESYHVTGATPTAERSKTINAFAQSPKALITNARCLTEGVDVPNIDCVLFADPKRSTIDIVQAVGRALRVFKGKQYGYVIIPVLSEEKEGEQVIDDESYNDLLLVLRGLASNDERIIEYFRLKHANPLSKGQKPKGDELFEIYAEKIDLEKLVDDVQLKIWNRLAKLSWRPFPEARKYAHGLKLKSALQWYEHCGLKKQPPDIPTAADNIYKTKGWINWSDWLGTLNTANQLKKFKSFKDGRKYVRTLNLKNEAAWNTYCKSGKKPDDIPYDPRNHYSNNGWKSMADWLGSKNIATSKVTFRPFSKARKFVHSLELKNVSEWRKYCKSKEKPFDIPSNPHRDYPSTNWKGWPNWLGNENHSVVYRNLKTFKEARTYVHSLGLKGRDDWRKYCKLKKIPSFIRMKPERYKEWKNWNDWLGIK